MLRDLRGARRITVGFRSFVRVALDLVLLYRALKFVDLPGRDRERQVQLRGDVQLTYRLNRGDICSLREVWIDEEYAAPLRSAPRTVVDLGANIGLASLWFAQRYGCRAFVAVEPAADNVRLIRRNMADNGIEAQVVEGAVGAVDGTAQFASSGRSHSGRLKAEDGVPVRVQSPATILELVDADARVDVLKVDIEGAEDQIFTGSATWLERVDAVLIEIHPWMVDPDEIVATARRAGFVVHPGRRPELLSFIRPEAGRYTAPSVRGQA
jgi:FkbM family methyltransferase